MREALARQLIGACNSPEWIVVRLPQQLFFAAPTHVCNDNPNDEPQHLQGFSFVALSDRSRAARKTSGVSRRDASIISYKKARSAKESISRTRSKISNRYASSSGRPIVGSSPSWATKYFPCPSRLRSPSRTRRVKAKVIEDRLASGKAVMISRAETARRALATYSYTRWMTDLISRTSGLSVNSMLLTKGNNFSSRGFAP